MKRVIILFIVGILLLAGMQTLFALGVSPGRTTVTDINLEKYSFNIINSENKNINLSITASGELASAINLERNYYELKSNENSKMVYYSFKLPGNLTPGEHKGKITVSEIGNSDSTFGAKLAVTTEIVVFIPYPSKYIESDLDISINLDNRTYFLIPVINRGTESIEKINAIVDIYKKTEKIATLTTDSISLDSMKRGELNAEWQSNDSFGRYHAKVILMYDSEVINLSKDFQTGNFSVGIFDLFIEDFELGSIVQMGILVENKWPEDLKEIYAEMILSNDTGKIVDISSAPINIDALSQIRIPLYWDTSGISEGNYSGKIIIHYNEFTSERRLSVEISKYGIGFELESGNFVFEGAESLLSRAVLTGLAVAGIITIVVYMAFVKKN